MRIFPELYGKSGTGREKSSLWKKNYADQAQRIQLISFLEDN